MLQPRPPSLFLRQRPIPLANRLRQFLFVLPELFPDVLEAGQGLDAAQTFLCSDCFLQIRGDERLDDNAASFICVSQDPYRAKSMDPIIGYQRTDMIPRPQNQFTPPVPPLNPHP